MVNESYFCTVQRMLLFIYVYCFVRNFTSVMCKCFDVLLEEHGCINAVMKTVWFLRMWKTLMEVSRVKT